MKAITEYINEATKQNKDLTNLPDNMKEWYDKCKNFCTAGAWNLTDPKLSVSDFNGLLEAAKEFDFTQIKGLDKRASDVCKHINDLVRALIDKDMSSIIKSFDAFSYYTRSNEYWFQSDLTRHDNGGYIAEATLIISMANFLGHEKNWWKNSNLSTNKVKREMEKIFVNK